jgi:excisionase family DNA binding protein
VKAPLLKLPANDVGEPDVIEVAGDGKQLVKLIALGMFTGGMHVIQHVGRQQPPLLDLAPVGDIMTADEVADFLRLDRKTVYDYAGRGEIPCQRLGKRILFSRAALVSWLASCSKGSSESSSA